MNEKYSSADAKNAVQGLEMKAYLDQLYKQFCNHDFVKDDPVLFVHRWKDKPLMAEAAGIISSAIAYGQRTVFIRTAEDLFLRLGSDDFFDVIKGESLPRLRKRLKGWKYRFNTDEDISNFLYALGSLYKDYGNIEEVFVGRNLKEGLDLLTRQLRLRAGKNSLGHGLNHLICDSTKGSTCKRWLMFLRWMVRKDHVDVGIWKKSLQPSQLYFPLDTHTGRLTRQLGLVLRNTNDWKTVMEVTEKMRTFDPVDPVKYDLALMGLGVSGKSINKR